MLDIDDLSPGDELPDDADVTCCGLVMDAARGWWTCVISNATCIGSITTRHGLIFNIRG
ncbi:hypothetical protein ACIQWN_28905 [Streptomyces vinaceus]|uniref:hypothetical protein n=1 Tax=Streptomyces vinaceus TaxID=1960 RepID=UPI003804E0A9